MLFLGDRGILIGLGQITDVHVARYDMIRYDRGSTVYAETDMHRAPTCSFTALSQTHQCSAGPGEHVMVEGRDQEG